MVPMTELDLEIPIMEALSGESFPGATSLQTQVIADRELEKKRIDLRIKCYKKVGFDVLTVDISAPEYWKPTTNPDGTMVDLWGRVLALDGERKAWVPYGTVLNSPEDFYNFQFPDPNSPGWAFSTEYSKKAIGEDMAICTFIRDPFAHAWEIFTPARFAMWMYSETKFISNVIEKLTKFNIEIIKCIADAGADFVVSGGDYCEMKGPMAPINFFRETIFPNLKKQVDAAHAKGLKFIKHTDGNVNPIINDLASIVDGLHSLDPSAGVDIGEIKAKYGHRLILMGNIAVDSLVRKSEDEVVEETKDCIEKASAGGGHILSSSNSWAAGVRLKNCLAMVEAGRKYGKYPVRI